MRVLGLVPARGGSKGVPRKNIRLLGGRPLLAYTAQAAQGSKRLSRIILSTNDAEIANVGQSCGLEVLFLRPDELAQDDTPTLPVVQHAVTWLERHGDFFDAVCLLQPTHPFRTSSDIDACIDLLDSTGADSVVTVLPVPAEHNPHWVYFQRPDGTLYLSTGEPRPIARRQELPPAFHREGSVYVTRRDVLIERDSLYGDKTAGYELATSETVNIDSHDDWQRAERLLARAVVAAASNQRT